MEQKQVKQKAKGVFEAEKQGDDQSTCSHAINIEGKEKKKKSEVHIKVTVVNEDEIKKSTDWLKGHALIGHMQGPRSPSKIIEG